MPVYCQSCGTGLPPSARFCSNCGTVVPVIPMPYYPGRQLFRPIAGRVVAGVCMGLAQTYGWDVAVVRIIAVVGFFCSGGLTFVAYLAGWIGIPEEPVRL